MTKARNLTTTALLVALASVLHVVEALLPLPYVVPGAKLGLANIVALYAVMSLGLGQALAVSILRTLIGGLLSGTFLNFGYYLSTAGALASTLVMYAAFSLSRGRLSVVGISVAGSFTHNVTQLLVAALLMHQIGVLFYLPALLFFAIPTGVFVGLLAARVMRAYPGSRVNRRQ